MKLIRCAQLLWRNLFYHFSSQSHGHVKQGSKGHEDIQMDSSALRISSASVPGYDDTSSTDVLKNISTVSTPAKDSNVSSAGAPAAVTTPQKSCQFVTPDKNSVTSTAQLRILAELYARCIQGDILLTAVI